MDGKSTTSSPDGSLRSAVFGLPLVSQSLARSESPDTGSAMACSVVATDGSVGASSAHATRGSVARKTRPIHSVEERDDLCEGFGVRMREIVGSRATLAVDYTVCLSSLTIGK